MAELPVRGGSAEQPRRRGLHPRTPIGEGDRGAHEPTDSGSGLQCDPFRAAADPMAGSFALTLLRRADGK